MTQYRLRPAGGITCDGRPDGHGDRHHAQEEADGLRHVLGAHQLERDGSHDADEAAVEQTHEQTHSNESTEHMTQRNHHGHQPDHQERGHLQRHTQRVSVYVCEREQVQTALRSVCHLQEDFVDSGDVVGHSPEEQTTHSRRDANTGEQNLFISIHTEALLHMLHLRDTQ